MLRYLEIKKQLMDIVSATAPGEKLEDRVTLCRKLDTTRTTLDKAIRELVQEGMLTSRKGSGTYVGANLKIKSTLGMSWCVVVPNITESIYNTLVGAIESVAQQKNINVILCSSNNDFIRQERFIRRLSQSGVAGFIIVPIVNADPFENQRLYSSLQALDIPFVFCNRQVEGVQAPIIASDDHYGGYMATRHLIERGYRRIAFIAPLRYCTSLDRCKGYMAALMESGMEIDRSLIRMPAARQAPIYTYDEAKMLLEKTDVDAFFAFSDTCAVQIAAAITDKGLRISDDIGLIGYGNTDKGYFAFPALSTISHKTYEIGVRAAEVLLQRCNANQSACEFDFYLFQPELVIRESSKGRFLP